jgi:hypothetical protein
MTLFEGGILRVLINEVGGVEKRFRISSEPDFAVMDN